MTSLVEESPYAAAVETKELPTTCTACFATKGENTRLQTCTACKVVFYCCKTCQENDWPDHKLECKFLRKCSPEIPALMTRLISRVAMKIARGDKSTAFNGRTIEDLMDHQTEMQEDSQADQYAQGIFRLFTQYHGEKFFVDKAEILSILGKITTNSLMIHGDMAKPLGRGLYLGLSIHNHSCSPDCFVIFDGSKAIVRTPNTGLKYSSELNIGYVVNTPLRETRRENLKKKYYFDCYCELCEDCTQDQWRQSIVSTCCEDGVCLLNPTANQLSCNMCKKISPISVAEALAANEELNYILSNTVLPDVLTLSAIDTQAGLQFAIELHEKFKKILSQFNIALVAVAERILTLLLLLKDTERIHKYALSALPAYKKYLAVGNPDLTIIMMKAAIHRGFNDSRNPIVLRLYEETYKLALISHGPEHKVATKLQAMINGFHN